MDCSHLFNKANVEEVRRKIIPSPVFKTRCCVFPSALKKKDAFFTGKLVCDSVFMKAVIISKNAMYENKGSFMSRKVGAVLFAVMNWMLVFFSFFEMQPDLKELLVPYWRRQHV
jgi:hypothetical protein